MDQSPAFVSGMLSENSTGDFTVAIGKILKSIFGGSSGSSEKNSGNNGEEVQDSEEYKGFTIVAAPIKEGGQYRTAGYISRVVDGEEKKSRFIRADNSPDKQQAIDHSRSKARQIVDEQGDRLLEREHL